MKYLRIFEKESDYTQYVGGSDDYVEPHVVLISTTDKVFYKQLTPPPPAQVGDIAYWDGSSVKTVPLVDGKTIWALLSELWWYQVDFCLTVKQESYH